MKSHVGHPLSPFCPSKGKIPLNCGGIDYQCSSRGPSSMKATSSTVVFDEAQLWYSEAKYKQKGNKEEDSKTRCADR